jgi:MFS family permease
MVIMVGLFGSLLGWFKDAGAGSIEAGQYAMWCVAGLCVFAALVAAKGLQPSTAQVEKKGPFVASLIDGLAQARNPRLALAYAAGMVSRGDMSVISTFFTLWLTQVGRSRGMDTADALKLGITFFIVLQTSALLWPPVVSFFVDRVDRALALALAMCLAAAGYLTVGFIADPLGPMMYGGAVLMGIGEMSGVLTAQSLVGQEAPAKSRGTVIGAFSFFGALGILTTVLIGGYLFDNWRPSAPFIYMGFVNCVLIVLASITFVLKPRPPAVVVGA